MLFLSIVNVDQLENGAPTQLPLDRAGALIGRAPHADWSLPDPTRFISSNHCEIRYTRGGDEYTLVDISTNGTFINGAQTKMTEPRVLREGDVITIGPYLVKASFRRDGERQDAAPPPQPEGWATSTPLPAPGAEWGARPPGQPAPGWPAQDGGGAYQDGRGPYQDGGGAYQDGRGPYQDGRGPYQDPWAAQRPSPRRSGLTNDPWVQPQAAISGGGPMGQVFVPPPVRPTYQPSPGASQVWDDLFRSNQSNWTPFGEPSQAPVAAPASPPGAREDAAWTALLAGAGLTGADLRTTPREAAFAAGLVLRRVVAGLFVLLQARAKAKAQLGAQGTLAELEGNSPLKYSLSPEEALLRLLRPKEPHYLAADRAVEDAFRDLQAHQVATLLAMQSALRTTLERFSPSAIRARTRIVGFWASLFPAARAAALWRAYEHDFEGVAQGSDEAFMDVFSRAFREAYEQADREGNSPRRR